MADVLKYTKGAKSAEAAATAFKIGEGRMPDTNEAIQIGNAFNPLKDSNTARWSENVSKNIGGDNLSTFVNTKMGYVVKQWD